MNLMNLVNLVNPVNPEPRDPREITAFRGRSVSDIQNCARFLRLWLAPLLSRLQPLGGDYMRLIRCASLVGIALLLSGSLSAQTPAGTADQIKNSANPELIGDLTKEMGATVPQASGAA